MSTDLETSIAFDFYGLPASVETEWHEVRDALRLDYSWFERRAGEAARDWPVGRAGKPVMLEVRMAKPDFGAFGSPTASLVTPRNVVYQLDGLTLIDYFGRALMEYDRDERKAVLTGEDFHIVHEAAYQFLMSHFGSHIDGCGLLRLHSLGLAGSDGGVAVMLPSGGGKSTLALRALEEDGVQILSEDTPLVDRHGNMHPFPLRIGVNATDEGRITERSFERIERMELQPKLVLGMDQFAESISTESKPLRHLVIGRRSLGNDATLEQVPRREVMMTLLREAVIGVGVYQGMEFVLQSSASDVGEQISSFALRARVCAGLRHAKVWRLTTGRDHERNWAALAPLVGPVAESGRRA